MVDPGKPLAGKTCLVTGGTAGIGEFTAIELARLGASVVIIARSPDRCAASLAKINAVASAPAQAITADLSSQAEVRRAAGEFVEHHDRLDVLLNNAGAMYSRRLESVDGIERTLALNHLAYFLLTNLLLDRLKASAPSRVVVVASEAHRMGRGINFADIEGKKSYNGLLAYGQSKLANILFDFELARRLEGTGVTVNALHPGFVKSSFTNGNGALGWLFRRMADVAAIPVPEGSKTSIYLASSPEVEGVTGRYFSQCKPANPAKPASDLEAASKLWTLSQELTGLTNPPTR
jgi:NAD(P)-dependent dehydrogenase (short-subunit alcohol dehydrogenase family)